MTDHRAAGSARFVVFRRKRFAEMRSDAQHVEEVRRNVPAANPLHILVKLQQEVAAGGRAVGNDGERFERRAFFPPVDHVRPCDLLLFESRFRILFPQHHDTAGLAEWQRLQNECVDDAEHGRVGTDAQSERDHGHDSESRTADEDSNGVAQVLNEVVHQSYSRGFPADFARLFEPAEIDERPPTRFFRRMPFLNELLDLHLDVELQLIVHLGFESRATEQSPDLPRRFPHPVDPELCAVLSRHFHEPPLR